jgi:hypothetical protein
MSNDETLLPVIQNDLEVEESPVCSPKIYVSNEEAAILASMRRLREHSLELKQQIETATGEDRTRLETELEGLRRKWKNLHAQRERAFIQKMIMLGHLPPNHPIE